VSVRRVVRRRSARIVLAAVVVQSLVGGVVFPQSVLGQVKARSNQLPTTVHDAQSPVLAIVSIANQRVQIFGKDGLMSSAPVSSGSRGHETPQGVFTIIEKNVDHRSNLYNDASMPFMQRLTWSGVALHAGPLPGYPASHGCIRLPYGFAQSLFKMTKLNMRVIVSPYETAPVGIEHVALFQPSMPADDTAVETPSSKIASGSPMMLGSRPKAGVAPLVESKATPQQGLQQHLARLRQTTADATQSAAKAKAAIAPKKSGAARLKQQAKQAQGQEKAAKVRLEGTTRTLASAKSEPQLSRADAANKKAEADLATASAKAIALRADADQAGRALTAAVAAAKGAEEARLAAVNELDYAANLNEPTSVFVSRQTQRIYVRRGRWPVLDAPITVKDPDAPIGTHVFTAVNHGQDRREFRWLMVTVPPLNPSPVETAKSKTKAKVAPTVPVPTLSENGKVILDRLEIPQHVRDRVTPYLQLGSSLIVSDLGLSFETGKGTEFIIQTRGEAEAIESVRRIVAERRASRR
jgi:cell division septum initiation protein DivIVA